MSLHRLLLWVSNSILLSVRERWFMSCDQCGAGRGSCVRAKTMPRLFLCLVSCCFVGIYFYFSPLRAFAHASLLFSCLPCHIVPFSTHPAASRPCWHVISYSTLRPSNEAHKRWQPVPRMMQRASAHLSSSDGRSAQNILCDFFVFTLIFNYFCLGKLWLFIILKLVKLAQCWKKLAAIVVQLSFQFVSLQMLVLIMENTINFICSWWHPS